MGLYYRVQRNDEPVSALLDGSRGDGWVASDEDRETQPDGLSCCEDIEHLSWWARQYGARLDGCTIVVVEGGRACEGRDAYEVRVGRVDDATDSRIPATWIHEYDAVRLQAAVLRRAGYR